jgi:hypothetical protein
MSLPKAPGGTLTILHQERIDDNRPGKQRIFPTILSYLCLSTGAGRLEFKLVSGEGARLWEKLEELRMVTDTGGTKSFDRIGRINPVQARDVLSPTPQLTRALQERNARRAAFVKFLRDDMTAGPLGIKKFNGDVVGKAINYAARYFDRNDPAEIFTGLSLLGLIQDKRDQVVLERDLAPMTEATSNKKTSEWRFLDPNSATPDPQIFSKSGASSRLRLVVGENINIEKLKQELPKATEIYTYAQLRTDAELFSGDIAAADDADIRISDAALHDTNALDQSFVDLLAQLEKRMGSRLRINLILGALIDIAVPIHALDLTVSERAKRADRMRKIYDSQA